jgi:phosphohistidine phosphatase SixA
LAALALIRHGEAGSREEWDGDDRLRPLSAKGWRQARALVESLSDLPLERILSSPYVRCVQSVEPLAEARRLTVEETDRLAEGTGLRAVLALFGGLAGTPSALCTHGDVMEEVCEHLVDRGLIRPSEARCEKGCDWILEERGGELVAARYVPAREV